MVLAYVTVVLLTWLTVVSLRTLRTLTSHDVVTTWTSAGWICTVLYDCATTFELVTRTHLPIHLPYLFLAWLAIAFVVAGVRDEPQADPWWWPTRLAPTRAQKRASRGAAP